MKYFCLTLFLSESKNYESFSLVFIIVPTVFLFNFNNFIFRIPNKQYHISTTTNKIYDITERKNFCSNDCFKKSNYLKDQISSSPLWLRDQEDMPEFKLLSLE